MGHLSESATIETDLFEHKTVKDDFINPCCFGEDFAAWLQTRLKPIPEFTLDEPVMEDFGWVFYMKRANCTYLVSLGYAQDGPVEEPATWVVTVEWEDINPLLRWFRKPDETVFGSTAEVVWLVLKTEPEIRFVGFGALT